MEEKKQSTAWTYVGKMKSPVNALQTPELNAPIEERERFVRVLDSHIAMNEKEIKEEEKLYDTA